jgi:hypothetical protein
MHHDIHGEGNPLLAYQTSKFDFQSVAASSGDSISRILSRMLKAKLDMFQTRRQQLL